MSKTLWRVVKPHARNHSMTVGIWKSKLGFSFGVFEKINSEYVNLLYDNETHRIALEPTEKEDRTAYKINKIANQDSWWVSFLSFIRHFDLDEIRYKRYKITQEGDLFIIDLNKPISDTKPRGLKKQKEKW